MSSLPSIGLGSGSFRSAGCCLSTAADRSEDVLRLEEPAPSKRALWEMAITEVLAGYYEPDENGRRNPESLYGSSKMWAHLNGKASRWLAAQWNG